MDETDMGTRLYRALTSTQCCVMGERSCTQPTFGICFDVDGVLARGAAAIPAAVAGFKRLIDDRRQPRVPVAFVTNSLSRNCDKAAHLSTILGVQVACFVH